jgi:hypothetical protein
MTSLSKEGKEKRIAGIKDRTAANKSARAAASEASNQRVEQLRADGDAVMAARLAALPGPGKSAAAAAVAGPAGEMGPALPPGAGANFDPRSQAEILADILTEKGPELGGAGNAAKTKTEVMGTFSAFAAGGMGVGNNIAERQLKVAEETRDAVLASGQVQE